MIGSCLFEGLCLLRFLCLHGLKAKIAPAEVFLHPQRRVPGPADLYADRAGDLLCLGIGSPWAERAFGKGCVWKTWCFAWFLCVDS